MFKDKNNYYSKNNVRVYVQLMGRVQGVAFRYYARKMASQLGVKGWIRNMVNGDVEAVIEGSEGKVTRMLEWCKEGPGMARVENVIVTWLPYTGEFSDFNIR
jgi:acylphosphatase